MNGAISKTGLYVLVALALAGCATPQSKGSDTNLPEILTAARQQPERRPEWVASCADWASTHQSDFPVMPFFAGLLDVPPDAAGPTFCAVIVEAVIAGDFSQEEQNAFRSSAANRRGGLVGALLRELLVAHERLQHRQAEVPADPGAPLPPAS